jgi:hypothetical protein
MLASSTHSNERRQARLPSVNFKEETYNNGGLRNEGQPSTRAQAEGKTQPERLILQTEN